MLLDLQNFFVREHVAYWKTRDVYDILDPSTGRKVGEVMETVGFLTQVMRWVISKHMMSTRFEAREHPGDQLVFTLNKPFALFRQTVIVRDASGARLGYFKSKVFSLGGGFYVYDDHDQLFAEIKGKWHGWDFKFTASDGRVMGSVSKKWSNLAKELFTSADNYVVSVSDHLANRPDAKILLLAAAIAIDSVYYEQGE